MPMIVRTMQVVVLVSICGCSASPSALPKGLDHEELPAGVTEALDRSDANAGQFVPVVWRVKADPALEPVTFPDGITPAFNVPSGEGVLYATSHGPFVALGKNEHTTDVRQVFDVRDGSPAGTLSGKYDFEDRTARLSPDGKYFLNETKSLAGKPSTVDVWSFKTGRLVRRVVTSSTPVPDDLNDFAGPDHFVTHRRDGSGEFLDVWTLDNDDPARTIRLTSPVIASHAAAFSTGRRFLALASSGQKLDIYDLDAGTLAGQMPLPESSADPLEAVALAFSPDGPELSGLFRSPAGYRIVVWELSRGEIVADHRLAAEPAHMASGAERYRGRRLAWLPGGRAWLVAGHVMVDRKSGRPTWIFRNSPADLTPGPRWPLDPLRLLAVVGPSDSRRLEVLAIPAGRINVALAALTAPEIPAYVRPGQPVRLRIDISDRGAARTQAKLVRILTDRLLADGIRVVDSASTVLHARDSETSSNERTFELSWEHDGLKTPLWINSLKAGSDVPGTFLQLAGALPYYIPEDPTRASLPGVTQLAVDVAPSSPTHVATPARTKKSAPVRRR